MYIKFTHACYTTYSLCTHVQLSHTKHTYYVTYSFSINANTLVTIQITSPMLARAWHNTWQYNTVHTMQALVTADLRPATKRTFLRGWTLHFPRLSELGNDTLKGQRKQQNRRWLPDAVLIEHKSTADKQQQTSYWRTEYTGYPVPFRMAFTMKTRLVRKNCSE